MDGVFHTPFHEKGGVMQVVVLRGDNDMQRV